jgi:NAD(P)-dependent dehydrogenase (short-subunit alcohol dehydrogenase family)
MTPELDGCTRKALVTGAARGIGAAIAQRLRGDGMEVVTLDRAEGCDLRVDLRTDELPDLGDIDVCVSNAAVTTTIAPAHKMRDEQWDLDMAVNLRGAYRVVRACLPGMRERGYGRIVVVSSGAARDGLPGQVAYAASKAGLGGMVRTIAAENAARGITANAVLPGMVATEAVLGMPDDIRDRVLAVLPAGRFVEPGEIAAVVAFLASPAAASVTGEELGVDGGLHLNKMSLGGPREGARP